MNKVAFLGAGNMASAMVEGVLSKQVAIPGDLACFSASGGSAARLAAQTGIRQAHSLTELFAGADVGVVAFKPQHLDQADPQLAGLTAGVLIVSVLSGKRLSRLQQAFPQARNVVRTMPNTPGRIGAGVTAWCSLHPLSTADQATVETLLGSLGRVLALEESDLDAVTAVSGSGPGFVFEFAGALRDAAIAAGLDPVTARTLVVETLLGSARLLARTGETPETLRNQVTSPNGATQAGLRRLEAGNFRALIRETVLAAKGRAGELSRDS
ncbi:MAG: pyrroline-5-carboxylate reductase [Tepidisphaerales bacterium]